MIWHVIECTNYDNTALFSNLLVFYRAGRFPVVRSISVWLLWSRKHARRVCYDIINDPNNDATFALCQLREIALARALLHACGDGRARCGCHSVNSVTEPSIHTSSLLPPVILTEHSSFPFTTTKIFSVCHVK